MDTLANPQHRAAHEQVKTVLQDETRSPIERIDNILELGLRMFGLDLAIVSHIAGPNYHVVQSRASPDLAAVPVGAVLSVKDAYCIETIAQAEPLCISHAGSSHHRYHPCYQVFRLESYIGMRLMVGGKAYGTLNFSSPMPRILPFSDEDAALMRQFAGLVERQLGLR